MSNKFKNMSREEIESFINEDRIRQEDVADLTKALQKMGLSSSITFVDDRNSMEGKAATEYIQAHHKIPDEYYTAMPENEIEWAKKIIFSEKALTEDKKRALIVLAHVGRTDVYKILKEYKESSGPDAELKLWADMASKECQNFLKSAILDEPFIDIKKMTKIGRNDPCLCNSGKKYKRCCGA
ncbi:MAG: hypothetical protein ACD_7C00492G0010 [uncultured bacterium]|nr:MAG: hypothetical protein ACD_7C00492G0010 [uncultured bacterium]